MKKLVFAASAFFAVSLAANVFALDFSADMVMIQKDVTTNAKVFMSGQRSRMEVPGSISISRMDKKVMWILMPEQKMYMEQAFDPSKMMVSSGKVEGELERTPLGKDTVDGKVTDKYKVTYEIQGMRNEMYQWIESGSNFPIKTSSLDGSWSAEYRNIKTGPQPDSLFEVPEGYKKFSMDMPDMGDMMKEMEKNE